MANIERLISDVRKLINRSRKQHLLFRDKRLWNQLCSSLDVIEDTDIAFDDYMGTEFPESIGRQYLVVYGLLQSLFVQQDAVDHLVESLGLSMLSASERLIDIRDIRNKSIGHPTKEGIGKGEKSYHFISRATMHKNGFQLMSSFSDKELRFTNVNIPGIISRQRNVIEDVLKEVLEELKKEEKEHKEKFKGKKLVDLFPNSLGYFIRKMYEEIHRRKAPPSLGTTHFKPVEKALNDFRQALEKRDLWEASESIKYIYEELEYPVGELKRYFEGTIDSDSSDKGANINLFFIQKKVEELKEIAEQIDEDYAQKESEKVRMIDYEGEIWAVKNKEPAPELLGFLTDKDCVIVLRHGKPPYKVVLGVPHQAAVGEAYICEECKEKKSYPIPRPSDENAASYTLVAFTELKQHDVSCKVVIMAHSTTIDPNKELGSLYCKEVFDDDTELIFECHGAKAKRHSDLELSAGVNELAKPIDFGRLLMPVLGQSYMLGAQKKAGGQDALIFKPDGTENDGILENPANETDSLEKAGEKKIPALHLEAKPAFRRPSDGSNTVTSDGLILGRGLAQALIKFLEE